VIFFNKLVVRNSVRKLASRYTLTMNTAFDEVVRMCHARHGQVRLRLSLRLHIDLNAPPRTGCSQSLCQLFATS
jgi:hypothetical protein